MMHQEIIIKIKELLELNNKSISSHPKELIDVYQKFKGIVFDPNIVNKILSIDVKLLENYMDSCTFISAWYQLKGDKNRRNSMAHSCVQLISSLGLDSKKTMITYIDNEKYWRKILKENNVAPINYKKIILFITFIGLVIGYFTYN
jgi:uncharacterized protein (UPF0335 family)